MSPQANQLIAEAVRRAKVAVLPGAPVSGAPYGSTSGLFVRHHGLRPHLWPASVIKKGFDLGNAKSQQLVLKS